MEKLIVEGFGNLAKGELTKHGPGRVKLLLAKILGSEDQGKDPLTLTTGEECKVDIQKSADSIQALQDYVNSGKDFSAFLKFTLEDGRTVGLGNFRKTSDFGGGGGVAGGSYQTKYYESGQCVVNALLQKNQLPDTFSEKLSVSDLNCSLGKGLTVEKVWNYLGKVQDLEWIETLRQTAEHLTEKIGNEGYWHWQDDFVESISKIYKSFSDKLPGTLDRWNPADIWYTDRKVSNVEEYLSGKTLESCADLTDAMDELCKSRQVVGISLKKKEGEKIQGRRRIPKEAQVQVSNIKVEPISSGACTLNIAFTEDSKDYILILRAGNAYQLRAGIKKAKGGTHFEGGCTQEIINRCLQEFLGVSDEDLNLCSPLHYAEATQKLQECYILDHQYLFTDEEITEAEKNLAGIYPLGIDYPENLIQEEEGSRILSGRRLANRQALDHIYYLLTKKASQEELSKFVTQMVKYCWSLVPESARHYKVF